MKIDLPLFESVLTLDAAIRARFPRDFESGLETLGTIFTSNIYKLGFLRKWWLSLYTYKHAIFCSNGNRRRTF